MCGNCFACSISKRGQNNSNYMATESTLCSCKLNAESKYVLFCNYFQIVHSTVIKTYVALVFHKTDFDAY